MALTNSKIKAAKPQDKPVKMADGHGLTLIVQTSGSKLWRLRYLRDGRETMVSLGKFPEISLLDARTKAADMRLQRAGGADPVQVKARAKRARVVAEGNNFAAVSEAYLAKNEPTWAKAHAKRVRFRLEKDAYPVIGNIPVAEITPMDVLALVRKVEERGTVNTAHRVRGFVGQVMRFAVASGLALNDPSRDIGDALRPVPKPQHRPALLDPEEVGEFLKALEGWNGPTMVKPALLIIVHVFQRPSEVRMMRWKDIDLKAGEWRYRVTKTSVDHIVPLSRQVCRILEDVGEITGGKEFVFAKPDVPFSDVMFSKMIKKIGFSTEDVVAHGFRATARTILAERLNFDPRIIELQLAHSVPETHGGAYNRAVYLTGRKAMMQTYSDFLDKMRSGVKDAIPH